MYTLTNIKYVSELSEETNCFFAKIRLGRKVVGEASNDGHGGPDLIHIQKEHRQDFFDFCLDWGTRAHYDGNLEVAPKPGFDAAECWIGHQLQELLVAMDRKRFTSRMLRASKTKGPRWRFTGEEECVYHKLKPDRSVSFDRMIACIERFNIQNGTPGPGSLEQVLFNGTAWSGEELASMVKVALSGKDIS